MQCESPQGKLRHDRRRRKQLFTQNGGKQDSRPGPAGAGAAVQRPALLRPQGVLSGGAGANVH